MINKRVTHTYVCRIIECRSYLECVFIPYCIIFGERKSAREKLQDVDKNPDDTKSHWFAVYLLSLRYIRRKLPLFVPLGLLVFVFLAGRSVSNSITNFTSGGFIPLRIFSPLFCNIVSFTISERKLNLRKLWHTRINLKVEKKELYLFLNIYLHIENIISKFYKILYLIYFIMVYNSIP